VAVIAFYQLVEYLLIGFRAFYPDLICLVLLEVRLGRVGPDFPSIHISIHVWSKMLVQQWPLCNEDHDFFDHRWHVMRTGDLCISRAHA